MGDINLNLNGMTQYGVTNADGQAPNVEGGGQPEGTQSVVPTLSDIASQTVAVLHNFSETVFSPEGKSAIREVFPEIDEADLDALGADMAELEQLIAELTLENQEEQAQEIAARIDAKIKEMEAHHEKVLKKVQESIDKAVEQQKRQEANKVLGWIMVALAIVAAAISIAATVITGGGSLAIAGCCLAGISALFSLTNQVLSATGVIERSIDERAEEYAKENNISKSQAKKKLMKDYQIGMMVAQGVLALASIGCGIASLVSAGKAVVDATTDAMKMAKILAGLRAVEMITQFISTGTGVASTIMQWDALFRDKDLAETQAELEELKAFLEKLKADLAAEQEDLEKLLTQIQDSLSTVLKVFEEEIENANKILDDTISMS